MTIYTAISKRIGWASRSVTIPPLSEVRELIAKSLNGDQQAYTSIFTIWRFAASPTDDAGRESINAISENFGRMRWVFEGQEVREED